MNRSRKEELELIRKKILEAIRFSERYWMIYKENTFGLATILDLDYKKSFIEILFFPNKDVIEKGLPLLKIYSPIETEVDFNEILIEPDFDDDGLISPSKIIERINKLIDEEFQNHLDKLNREVELIDKNYENYPIEDIPYYRKIIIYFPGFYVELKINFEEFPLTPKFYFSKFLSKIIELNEFLQLDIIKEWNELKPPHIVDLIEHLINLIIKRINITEYYQDFQHLILNDISIGRDLEDISFKLHRGESLGIMYKSKSEDFNEQLNIIRLYETIKGENQSVGGTLKIFGKFIQFATAEDFNRIFMIPEALDTEIVQMKVKKAIKAKINIRIKWYNKRQILEILKQTGLLSFREELLSMSQYLEEFSYIQRYKLKKEFINSVLELTGLMDKRNKRVSNLKPLDYLLFSIARVLIQSPDIIMFSMPKDFLNRLQYQKFNNYLQNIKKEFHIVLLVHGPEYLVSKCDKVLTITEKVIKSGSKEELIGDIPQSGEIISIELNYPEINSLEEMYDLEDIIVVEERKGEKYKLYPKKEPSEIIKKLVHIFGQDLYSFNIHKASLNEYVQYLELINP